MMMGKTRDLQRVAYLWVPLLMAVCFLLSAAPTAQNSPELHFRFINSFIQPSLVGSLVSMYPVVEKLLKLITSQRSYALHQAVDSELSQMGFKGSA